MSRIFISYRRADSGMFTGRIHDQLKASFGANNVFRDMYNIPAGSDFRSVINESITSTDICLVIIGPQWLNITDTQGKRRLDDPNDFVRIEVESALKNPKTRVIPVLVDNATMPVVEELPPSLMELAYRNAVKVRTDPDFPHDMEILIRQLQHPTSQRIMRSAWLVLPILLILISGFFLLRGKLWNTVSPSATPTITVHPSETKTATARPSETATATATLDLSTPTPLVEPVAPGEIMVLVAQIEPIKSTQKDDVTNDIVDDLVRRFETEKLVSNVRVREYGEMITSSAQAQNVAELTRAVLVVWGQYDDSGTTINLQLGSTKSLPDLVLDRATLDSVINIRLQMKDTQQETLAYPIVGALGALVNAGNDYVGTMRLVLSLNQLEAQKPEIIGNSVAAHTYSAMLTFLTDPQTAKNELKDAIELDASNPFLYAFRALVYQGMGDFQLGRQDSETAIRLAPDNWIIPYYLRGNESLITNNLSDGIDAYSRVIDMRPNDWFPYNQRGYLYLLAHQYEQARIDIDKSISLGPEAEWPYMWGMLIAIRQGRLEDASVYMKGILSNPSKNPVFIERLMVSLFGKENATLLGTSMSAIGHFAFVQFDTSIQEADTVLTVAPNYPEMYLIKGLSYCNIDDYQKADEAYSAGLEVDPTFTMLYFLRAEVRARLGDVNGATEDLTVVGQSDISENLKPYIEAAQSGQFSCKDVTATK